MTIFFWLRNPFRPIATLDHPEFGEVIAISRLKGGNLYWESKKEIAVGSHTVLLVFVAPESGPSEAQLAHWRYVCGNLSELSNRGREFIQKELAKGKHILTHGWPDASLSFTPTLVALPDSSCTKQLWSMSFEANKDGDVVAVDYERDNPIRIEVN